MKPIHDDDKAVLVVVNKPRANDPLVLLRTLYGVHARRQPITDDAFHGADEALKES
jgi:hypothetical protein